MSLRNCSSGSTQGFPIKLSQKLNDVWTGETMDSVNNKLKKLTVPTDFSVSWGPPSQNSSVSVIFNQTVCQIRGIDTVSDSTTLTYGRAQYKCSSVISIVKNQHATLTNTNASDYEVILAFQLQSKSDNPSSPDVILITRPLVFGSWNSTPFWAAVNTAMLRNSPQSCVTDLSTMFAYNSSTLMPMITYESCLPVKLLNYNGAPSKTGSINLRVNVITQPIYVVADQNGLGQCSSVTKYTLITEPRNPVNMFDSVSANTIMQFKDGYGSDGFPVPATTNLIPQATAAVISDFNTVLNTISILVPEAFLGKSLSELSDIKTPAPLPKRKKAYKCYRIDSEKDIKNDQILVDPETGEPLSETMRKELIESAGGDPSLLGKAPSGLMPGDVEHIMFIILTTLMSFGLFGYLIYTVSMIQAGGDTASYGYYNLAFFGVMFLFLVGFSVFFGKS